MLDESDIQKLLRLKRYEQPPPQYFETFLHDFHRRQRVELLREPAWKIAIERVQAFIGVQSMSRLAYAGATAAVLVFAGIASFNILDSSGPVTGVTTAQASRHEPNSAIISGGSTLAGLSREANQSSAQHPRYVIDTQPASYERSFSF